MDDEEVEPDSELQTALARARRLRQAEERTAFQVPKVSPPRPGATSVDRAGGPEPADPTPQVEEILEAVAEEPEGAMVLDATAEFCRTLGDIPTYGLAGNREHQAEILVRADADARAALQDFERDEADAEAAAAAGAGAWSRVDVGRERPAAAAAGAGLDAEPRLGAGVAGALQLALSKGYLERAGAAPAPRSAHLHLLAAKHYSIEDKTYG